MMRKLLLVAGLIALVPAFAETIYIYDEEPTEKAISLTTGDTLEVHGNGLTANCTVSITHTGTTGSFPVIKFVESATVAAAIDIQESGKIMAEAGKTVVITGKLTAQNSTTDAIIYISAEDGAKISFKGGADLTGTGFYNTFRIVKGEIEIVDKPFTSSYGLSFTGGHLVIKNGGTWTAKAKNAGICMGRPDQDLDATLEIGKDGSVTLGNNQQFYLGYKSGKTSKLYINGGTLTLTTADKLYFNYHYSADTTGGDGNAVLEIDNGGVLDTWRPFMVGSTDPEKAKVILGKGTWKGYNKNYNYTYLVDHNKKGKAVALDFFVKDEFTFDFSTANVYSANDARPVDGSSSAVVRWFTSSANAHLVVEGKSSSVANNFFTMHSLSTSDYPLALTLGKDYYGVNLNLIDAASELKLAPSLPLKAGVKITASGTAPELTTFLRYADSSTTPVVITEDLANSGYVGFDSIALGDALTIDTADGGQVYVAPELSTTLNTIKVDSGTLVLQNDASIASGVKVETAGDGSLALIDATGFDEATRMSGTKSLVSIDSNLVVTDTARTDAVSVGNGETLYVYGSGLTASASVALSGGSTLVFMAPATISAPVNAATGTVTLKTVGGATGTLAGKFTQAGTSTSTIDCISDGLLSFIGGGEIGNGSTAMTSCSAYFKISAGEVQITNQAFSVGCKLMMVNGHLKIAEQGSWTVNASIAQYAHVDLNQHTGDVCLEVGKDSFIRIGNNTMLYVGNNSIAYEARLFLNGGTFYRDGGDNTYIYGNGIIEVDNGGRLAMSKDIRADDTTGKAKVIFRNGSWDANNGYKYSNASTSMFSQTKLGTGNVKVSLEGDFTIDLKHYNGGVVSNTCSSAASWEAKPGARLRVICDNVNTKKLDFYDFDGDGLAIDLNGTLNTDVEFADRSGPIDLGFVLPGHKDSSRLIAKGTAPDLTLRYIIPSGYTYTLGTTGLEGSATAAKFGTVTYPDLEVEEGATIAFPFADEPTVIAGTLTLPAAPATVNYKLTGSQQPMSKLTDYPLVTATSVVGSPTFVYAGGLNHPERAELTADATALKFSYALPGFTLFLR